MRKLITLVGVLLMAISSFAALPSKVFAPYVDVMLWPTFDLASAANASGQKYFTLAFITAGGNGQPAWGGVTAFNAFPGLDEKINALRAQGGDVIVSFGGAIGTPIDASITNVSSLVAAYSAVIDRYGLTWIDFDIEGSWVADQASIDRRNQAAKQLQAKYPSLRITYCLPVMPTGLTADGVNIINKAKAAGVNIYGVNVMAMDYGQSNSAMGQAAISAAQNTRNQTNLNIGITPMIGKNDTQNETFSLANANEVLNFAKNTSWVNMIAMWSANRDNGGCPNQTLSPTCSGISQGQYAFINIFKSYSGNTGGCTSTPINPYLSVNSGPWQNVTSATLAVGGNITIGPQPLNGTWKWTGPNGFSSTSRSITRNNIQTNQGGSYTATYTNPQGCNSTLTFTITVTGGGGGTFSQTIEAENYTNSSGVIKEACSEGGQNVGSFDAGDWTVYNVSIPSSGTYKVSYRVASIHTGRTLRLEKDAGATLLGTINIPNTGNWQAWTSVSHNVTLPAGTYTIGLATTTGGLNINRFHITNNLSARSVTDEISVEAVSDEKIHHVYPNPIETNATITVNIRNAGHTEVDIMDAKGSKSATLHNGYLASGEHKFELNAEGLPPGFYLCKVNQKGKVKIVKIIKK
jgi:hypothetical protein